MIRFFLTLSKREGVSLWGSQISYKWKWLRFFVQVERRYAASPGRKALRFYDTTCEMLFGMYVANIECDS